MNGFNFDLRPLIYLPIILCLLIWGCWELIDWLFIPEVLKSEKLITPEIQLVIKNNVVDTLYIYKIK